MRGMKDKGWDTMRTVENGWRQMLKCEMSAGWTARTRQNEQPKENCWVGGTQPMNSTQLVIVRVGFMFLFLRHKHGVDICWGWKMEIGGRHHNGNGGGQKCFRSYGMPCGATGHAYKLHSGTCQRSYQLLILFL